jgi:hypothetical protein
MVQDDEGIRKEPWVTYVSGAERQSSVVFIAELGEKADFRLVQLHATELSMEAGGSIAP